MSADEPLVTRIAGMITRAKEKKESLENQVEDVTGTLASLEMAEGFAKVLEHITKGAVFEMEFRVVNSSMDNITLVCSGGTNAMALVRDRTIALLDAQVKELAEL